MNTYLIEKHSIAGAKQGLKIYCIEANLIFNSISDAAVKLNLSDGNICSVLKGRIKSTKGYSFIYLEGDLNEQRNKKIRISLELSEDLAAKIKAEADKLELSTNAFIKLALQKQLDKKIEVAE